MAYVEGSKPCQDCGALCWEKDMRKGRCIDCLVKYYEKKLKQMGLPF